MTQSGIHSGAVMVETRAYSAFYMIESQCGNHGASSSLLNHSVRGHSRVQMLTQQMLKLLAMI